MKKKAKTQQQSRQEAALKHALKKAPKSEFVISCKAFYDDRGFLTVAQVAALENIEKPGKALEAYTQNYHNDWLDAWDWLN